ncbi:NACHT domain-containing protein [Leptothoe sp. EHU-05/26/07-4]
MLEWLVASTGIELGKLVLEQVLDLGKPVLEGYVQDFFKACLNSSVAQLNATKLKTPMAEAIGYFIQRFIKELQINEVPETSIRHFYKAAIKRFVQDKAVCPILGKAFEKNIKQIDHAQLESIWQKQYQNTDWQFPSEEFDWRGISKEYVYQVRRIVKANAELRALLETDFLEEISQNTKQISPGFDIEKYRESLQFSYGYLKLYTLDRTDRAESIKLWTIFIEQTVREALPPTRYELPSDLKRKLKEEGLLENDLSSKALDDFRREYFQQPIQKVLEVLRKSQKSVILGDPGSGKSSLLQYLALEWVEGKTEVLPLLIELREFAIAPSANFLEYLHCGQGVNWQFDQKQLHQHLLEFSTLVMFDGLDEIFDHHIQHTVISDIVRFCQKYSKAQVLVTSRIIGYNPEKLQQSGFRHFTIQSLNINEIHSFIDCWYDLSIDNEPDKVMLKERLKLAIASSRAIANLADNPLLLTMMTILNRRQELPRDRIDLYEQASHVLLHHWDVDHKRLQLPMGVIGRREKQEILRLIAYEMQSREEGLKGNLIEIDRLTRILTAYLRDQGFSTPREKANQLIQHLRERNFILCYRGADTYGFVHRTFLEYFCAVEIFNRFEKQQLIDFEQLREEIFGQHWRDETWHEVLRLLCGMLTPELVDQLIKFLLEIEIDKTNFLDDDYEDEVTTEGLTNLLLASDCMIEAYSIKTIPQSHNLLLELLKQEIENPKIPLNWGAIYTILKRIASYFPEELNWLYSLVNESSTLQSKNVKWLVRRAAVFTVSQHFCDRPETLPWLQEIAQSETDGYVRGAAVESITAQFYNEPETFQFVLEKIQQEKHGYARSGMLMAFAKYFRDAPETLPLLKIKLQHDEHAYVRETVLESLIECFRDDSEIFELLCKVAIEDPFVDREYEFQINPRQVALVALSKYYSNHPKTLEILHDRAINDPDSQLREWAQQQLSLK